MTVNINLLPWRALYRQSIRRRFFIKAAVAFTVAIALLMAGRTVVQTQLSAQEHRNARLQQEIDQLNLELRNFANREVKRDELERRLKLVNALQKQRNNATLLFNLLPQITPDGVVLDKVMLNQGTVTLEGRSRDNAKLASLLALLESDNSASNVQMHSIVTENGSPTLTAKRFRATFYLEGYTELSLPEEDDNAR